MQNQALIVDTNVREFFQGLVHDAIAKQQVDAADETLYYVVNLLVSFTDTRTLYDKTPEGLMIRPLAGLYGEAVDAPSPQARHQALKRLGDLALFIAGVFTDSLNRKPVDVDYYIAMGGNAYGYLSDTTRHTGRLQTLSDVFGELADKFPLFVDVLGDVCEHAHFRNDRDVLRLYELWVRTGSPRAARQLRKLGIEPACGSVSRQRH